MSEKVQLAIRPVIAIDGTFLKGKYKGTMFVTLCMDGNNQIYLLAFGISDSEDDASWEAKLRDLISNVKDLVFISNPKGSIKKGCCHDIFRCKPLYVSSRPKSKVKFQGYTKSSYMLQSYTLFLNLTLS